MKITRITLKSKLLVISTILSLIFTIEASGTLTAGQDYYIWLNIYEKLLGSSEDGTKPALSAYGQNSDADSYVFTAESSGSNGYVLLKQKSTGRYLAASSSSSYSVVFETTKSSDSRYCWSVDEGAYTYLVNKKNNKYLGVDGANKGSTYVSVYYDKPKGSHSQFTAIPVSGSTWAESCQAYESKEYTNGQGVKEIDYIQLKDKTIDRSDAIDIHITCNDKPISGSSSINLGSDRTWLIIDNIVPSTVASTYLRFVKIKGKSAINGNNCRVAIYLNGSVIIPTPEAVMTCSGTKDFTLSASNHKDLGANSNAMTSFVLRRGYMATLATSTGGTGYSRVYVADHSDLTVELPKALTKRVTSVNIKPWQYLSKKGWGNTSGKSGADQLRATWFWSWSAGYSSTTDLEYVPCRQHLYWPSASDVNNKTATASLSLNEPEHSEQHTSSQCTCGGTIGEWKAYTINNDFLPGGGRIGSPQPTDLGYLTTFCTHVDNMASRCDFTVTHAYWDLSSYNESNYANWFCDTKCKSVWNNTGRPLWLTEMEISASWNSNKITSYDQNRKYLQVLLQKIEECPWIERYAIYGTDMWQTYMFYEANPSKGLTPAGQVYRDHRSTFAYNKDYTKIPNWWAPSTKAPTLDHEISASTNSMKFIVGNTNGDYTETLVLQRKPQGGNWQAIHEFTDRSTFDNSILTVSISLDEIDQENDKYRVVATTIFGESSTSSETTTGMIVNPNIETTSQNSVEGWTCIRNAANGFTKAASGDTYLEVWNADASSIDFNYYQDLDDIPNGVYKLSAVCFNSTNGVEGGEVNGNVGLYASSDGICYYSPITVDSEIDYDRLTTIDKIVVRNGKLRIGIRNIGVMGARWAGADNFDLLYLGSESEVLDTDYDRFAYDSEQSLVSQFQTLSDGWVDASGLIVNSDCARATTDLWDSENISTDKGKGYDGNSSNNYFNYWKSGAYDSHLEQVLDYLPAGRYKVSALLRGTTDLPLNLTVTRTNADGTTEKYVKTIQGKGEADGHDYQFGWNLCEIDDDIEIVHGDRLTIRASISTSGTAWWSADHFQLKLKPAEYTEPDAIKETYQTSEGLDNAYDLQGRKIDLRNAHKGIYIINGKKVVRR